MKKRETIEKQVISEWLYICKKKRITQMQIALELGLSRGHINRIFNFKAATVEEINQITNLLKTK